MWKKGDEKGEDHMIGHYLLTLTPEQEDRVLTQPFEPVLGPTINPEARCLLACATDGRDFEGGQSGEPIYYTKAHGIGLPGFRYEYLCQRFSTTRVNVAIRNRILTNQARRILATHAYLP